MNKLNIKCSQSSCGGSIFSSTGGSISGDPVTGRFIEENYKLATIVKIYYIYLYTYTGTSECEFILSTDAGKMITLNLNSQVKKLQVFKTFVRMKTCVYFFSYYQYNKN